MNGFCENVGYGNICCHLHILKNCTKRPMLEVRRGWGKNCSRTLAKLALLLTSHITSHVHIKTTLSRNIS